MTFNSLNRWIIERNSSENIACVCRLRWDFTFHWRTNEIWIRRCESLSLWCTYDSLESTLHFFHFEQKTLFTFENRKQIIKMKWQKKDTEKYVVSHVGSFGVGSTIRKSPHSRTTHTSGSTRPSSIYTFTLSFIFLIIYTLYLFFACVNIQSCKVVNFHDFWENFVLCRNCGILYNNLSELFEFSMKFLERQLKRD